MKPIKLLQSVAIAMAFAVFGTAIQSVQAQEAGNQSDTIVFGPASNPGGLVGFINLFETNTTEFSPAFLPASANVPNNIGIILYEDASQSVVSDQLWTQAGFWYFASDPNLINFAQNGITPVGAIVENGNLQDVSSFFLLLPGSMQVESDAVPEPATIVLVSLGTASLVGFRRRK